MPYFTYECTVCNHQFDEFRKINEASGKSWCEKCGEIAFKLPSLARPMVFKQRQFADGTKTPDNVRTFEQEEKWKKGKEITYDTPTGKEKRHRAEERKEKSKTVMKEAFLKAEKRTLKEDRAMKEKIQKAEKDNAM